MNAYAIFAVNEHMDFLLAEAAQRRLLQTDKPSILKRIVSAASTALTVIDTPADYSRSILPTLDNYPYQS